MKQPSNPEWRGWNFCEFWQKTMKQQEKDKISLLIRMLPKKDEKRNTNMPNGIIDSKSDVHENTNIINTNTKYKTNWQIQYKIWHYSKAFVYLCICVFVYCKACECSMEFKCQRMDGQGMRAVAEGKASQAKPPSPAQPQPPSCIDFGGRRL